jgi:predicted lipoprotein
LHPQVQLVIYPVVFGLLTILMKEIKYLLLLAAITTFGCKKKDKNEDGPTSTEILDQSFNKAGMLSNMANTVIVPEYEALKTSVDNLKVAGDAFASNSNLTSLTTLQSAFLQAYTAYQKISVFEFGPADNELVRANFNTFPCDTVEINSKIASNNMSLTTIADLDSKGFPAIDFLLYANGNNNVLAKFTTDANASNAINYLNAVILELKQKTDNLVAAWASYDDTFTSNTSSDVGSSIGNLVNQLSYDLELLKNAKIGIPSGAKSLGTALPEKAEGFYSTQSLALVKVHLNTIENVYLGNGTAGDQLGFDDYLIHLGAMYTSGPLNDAIKGKFASAKAKLNAIPETLSQSVINNNTLVTEAYNELQQLVVLIKVDMTSALGVAITYQDNDGD